VSVVGIFDFGFWIFDFGRTDRTGKLFAFHSRKPMAGVWTASQQRRPGKKAGLSARWVSTAGAQNVHIKRQVLRSRPGGGALLFTLPSTRSLREPPRVSGLCLQNSLSMASAPTPSTRARRAEAAILCGTDFTAQAQAAFDVALLFGLRLAAPVQLLHASAIPASPLLSKKLKDEVRRVRPDRGQVTARIVSGDPVEVLTEYAQHDPTRLVVLSAGSGRKTFLGSVAESTAELAPVPTLVVRDAQRLTAWLRGEHPLSILVALDLTASSRATLRWVTGLRDLGPCRITVGHVAAPGEKKIPRSSLIRDLKARATEVLGAEAFELRVQEGKGRVDDDLVAMASAAAVDLVAVGAHQYQGLDRLWHRSVSRGLLQRLPASIAVVPAAVARPSSADAIPWVWRVLVSTDFSVLGNRAIPHGYAALPMGGVLKLVHVISKQALPDGEFIQGPATRETAVRHRALIRQLARQLQELIPAEAAGRNIETEIEILEHDDPAQAICKESVLFDAGLVCLGSHGRTGLTRTVFGSVAQAVVLASRRPVLLVRPDHE